MSEKTNASSVLKAQNTPVCLRVKSQVGSIEVVIYNWPNISDYDDIEVIEADENGRESGGFIPTNNNGPNRPGFKLLTPEDLAREDALVISASNEAPLLKGTIY